MVQNEAFRHVPAVVQSIRSLACRNCICTCTAATRLALKAQPHICPTDQVQFRRELRCFLVGAGSVNQ